MTSSKGRPLRRRDAYCAMHPHEFDSVSTPNRRFATLVMSDSALKLDLNIDAQVLDLKPWALERWMGSAGQRW